MIDPVLVGNHVRAPESLGQILFTKEGRFFEEYLACRFTGPIDVAPVDGHATGA